MKAERITDIIKQKETIKTKVIIKCNSRKECECFFCTLKLYQNER